MSFDLVAPVYDALSRVVFGRSLQAAQTLFLPEMPPDSTILVVGGGTGALLMSVLIECSPKHVMFLEASEQMLARARRRVQDNPMAGRVDFRHGTEADLQPGETFSVVMLPFVLDLIPETDLKQAFLPRLIRATAPGGVWLVTDFVNSPRLAHRLILKTMYLFFRLASGIRATHLPDSHRLLTEAGFQLTNRQMAVDGQVEASYWTLAGATARG